MRPQSPGNSPSNTPGRAGLKRFWTDYAARYRWFYALGVVFLLATTALTVAVPAFVERAIDALERGQGPAGATGWALAILLAGAAVIVVRTLSRTLIFNPGRTIEFRLKNSLFEHLLELPQQVRDRLRPGELISRGTNDSSAVRALVGFGSLALMNTTLLLAMTIVQMLLTHWQLTLMCLAPLVLSGAALMVGVKLMWRQIVAIQQQIASLSDRILETYNGVSVLHAFNAHAGARRRFDIENDALVAIGLTLTRIRSWILPIVSVVGSVCLVIVLWAGGHMVKEGSLTVGQLAAFTGYITIVVTGLTTLGWGFNSIQRGYVALGRIFEVLETRAGRDPATAAVPTADEGGLALRVHGLNFAFPPDADAKTPQDEASPPPLALTDLNFEVRAGETLGIFGLTGAGKTTLLNLISRVYDPPPGTVFVGGVDVRTLEVTEFWDRVTYVPQEAFLFSRSIRDNIGLSGGHADGAEQVVDHARVEAAAHDAALTDDLLALPDGLDTLVGERGITLSGGQRQRSALARAFYREFDLLLLDDVMSAVDHATEERLIEAVYRRGAGSTTVIVSHRVGVLSRADRIVVLDGGKLVSSGTHEELLASDALYKRAWELQQSEENEESPLAEVAGGAPTGPSTAGDSP